MIGRKPGVGNRPTRPSLSSRRIGPCAFFALVAGSVAGCEPNRPAPPPLAEPDPSLIKVDVHMHIDPSQAEVALRIMAKERIVAGLNASGGMPERGLAQSERLAASCGGRIRPLCNLDLNRMLR